MQTTKRRRRYIFSNTMKNNNNFNTLFTILISGLILFVMMFLFMRTHLTIYEANKNRITEIQEIKEDLERQIEEIWKEIN